jgi:hypothetical protein
MFTYIHSYIPSSSVGIATGYGLDGRGSIPGRGKTFLILLSVKTGSEAHPVACKMGTGVSFPGVKASGA